MRWLAISRAAVFLCVLLLAPVSAASAQEAGDAAGAVPDYAEDVQPIFNHRCIACHGCLGSPCNVKLDSFAGVDRGGMNENPYASHLFRQPRTDMDAAFGVAAWRERGFYPILSRDGTPSENLAGSLLYQMVAGGSSHNAAGFSREALERSRPKRYEAQCQSTPATVATQLAAHPEQGMPYGLPAISEADFATLTAWIGAGSPGPSAEWMAAAEQPANPEAVAAWEAFFNTDSPRAQLVSRYIFQHMFLATIVLEDSPGDRFRLVRSSTPPAVRGEASPVRVIATDLPYDDPLSYAGVDRFWYRLQKITQPPMQKNLILWELAPGDIADLSALFAIDSGKGWDAGAEMAPPYGIENPFVQFAAMPAGARARFMLQNAEVIVGGITYGPVCNGQTATYAVKDQFWVRFVDPEHDPSVQVPLLGLDDPEAMMDRSPLGNAAYLGAFAETKARIAPEGWSLDTVWDGGGENANAWLTVLRHQTNVSVMQGARGGMPHSLWLIDYAGFERLYYDTVAGFAYYGGDASKLETLGFFNLLRQNFEDHFLLLLPPEDRQPIRDRWTRGIGEVALTLIPFVGAEQPSQVTLTGTDPLAEIVAALAERAGPRITGLPDRLNPPERPQVELSAPMASFDDFERAISTLTGRDGQPYLGQMPSVTVVRLRDGDTERVYSLVVNRAYASNFLILFQDAAAEPERDTLSVYPGLVNGFPNLFVDLDLEQAPGFLTDLVAVKSAGAWDGFIAEHAILRNSAELWPFYDWLNAWNVSTRGPGAGWLDLSYYDAPED